MNNIELVAGDDSGKDGGGGKIRHTVKHNWLDLGSNPEHKEVEIESETIQSIVIRGERGEEVPAKAESQARGLVSVVTVVKETN